MDLADIDLLQVAEHTPPRAAAAAEGTNSIYEEALQVKLQDEEQPIEQQPVAAIDTIESFRSSLETVGKSAAKSYAKALASLRSFIHTYSLQYEPLDTAILTDWLLDLAISGHTLSTLTLYLNAISSLSALTGPEAPGLDFPTLRSALKSASAPKKEPSASALTRNRRRSPNEEPSESAPAAGLSPVAASRGSAPMPALTRAVHRAAIAAGGLTLEAAARLRRDDLPRFDEPIRRAIEQIAAPYADPRRRYLFPLDQSNRTPRQLVRQLTLPTSPGQEWLTQAMSLGATPIEAIAALGRNPFPADALVSRLITLLPHQDSTLHNAESSAALRIRVAETLTEDPLRWYALRLRQGVTPGQLLARIKLLAASINQPNGIAGACQSNGCAGAAGTSADLDCGARGARDRADEPESFYPLHRVARRTPTGIHHTEEPLLPGVLFLRLRATELPALLHNVGDIAWCYRDPGLRDYSYAPIPDRQMQAFQLAIGIFTEETRVAPLGTIEPRPGQRVIILSGPLTGHTATFVKTKKLKSKAASGSKSAASALNSNHRRSPNEEPSASALNSNPRCSPNEEPSASALNSNRRRCHNEEPSASAPAAGLSPVAASRGSSPAVLYRLRLPGLNGIEWEADLDPRILELINN